MPKRVLPIVFMLPLFISSAVAENMNFENCGFKLELLGKTSENTRSVPLGTDKSVLVLSRTATQHEEMLNTIAMCMTFTGVEEEPNPFRPEVMLRRETGRFEDAGWTLVESKLVDDSTAPNRRNYQFRAEKAEQKVVAKGMYGYEPRTNSFYSIQVMALSDLETEVDAELQRVTGSMRTLTPN